MNLWLASADLRRIERILKIGIFRGVITNPDVIAQSRMSPQSFFAALTQLYSGPMFYQVRDGESDEMVGDAEAMIGLFSERLWVKIPATANGLAAITGLRKLGATVAATCVTTSPLAVLAVAAGANFVIPYGSIIQRKGLGQREELHAEIQEILDCLKATCEMIVGASTAPDLVRLAKLGVRNAFLWDRDVDDILRQPLTEEAAAEFHPAWEALSLYKDNQKELSHGRR